MGISDGIERFLQQLLRETESGQVEIQRNTLANQFGCVPSQINYVIQTRFTTERGYTVESRRGGGGYVRIQKVSVPENAYIMHIVNSMGDEIDYETAKVFIENMVGYGRLTVSEGRIMLAAITDKILSVSQENKDRLRAAILKNMLVNVRVQ